MKPTSEEKEAEVQRLLDEIQKTLKALDAQVTRLERERDLKPIINHNWGGHGF